MNLSDIKTQLLQNDPAFWSQLTALTQAAAGFDDLIFLSALRNRAVARGLTRPGPARAALRLAILGGYSLYPLHELLTHLLETEGITCKLFLGEYDNYIAEVMEGEGALYQFRPQVIILLPGAQRCKHPGKLTDSREAVQASANKVAARLLELCRTAHERTAAEILLGNFPLPAHHDPGAFRSRILASDWNFRKWVNLELGLNAPAFIRICDLEFLTSRHGTLASEDARGWFESKQPGTPALLVEVAREIASLIHGLRTPPKKVLVLDLDDTLWGGVVADEGVEGIELGDTSPRGEAFKAFQKYLTSLKDRGVLLAVCSKNDLPRALEPFERHPEMVLHAEDFVSFKANWQPKSDNLWQMAVELNLGLDSFVFADDNPAEIEIVRQFAPEVTTILLGPDPADYVGQLQDCRLFESHTLTGEDGQRTGQYRAETKRQTLLTSTTDMNTYLESLAMTATICEFTPVDAPRLAQLTNKSNQFNLTTRRRTEAEVLAFIGQRDWICFSVRLADRFGDHGLISIVISRVRGEVLEIDTWLMSCRVLKRQVEFEALNELVRLAKSRGCIQIAGDYLPTAKNEMVSDFYPRMGFTLKQETPEARTFELTVAKFQPVPTKIKIMRRAYDGN